MSASLRAVLARHFASYRQHHRLDAQRLRVCDQIRRCRTPALGGQRLRCNRCGAEPVRYHSCRDRHCPRCQWAERQRRALLAVTYYHLVFTLPSPLNPWAELHPEVLYRLLFKTAWAVLSAFAQDPKRLGGQLGMTAVLHTWGQQLGRHLHLHCLIPGGAWTVSFRQGCVATDPPDRVGRLSGQEGMSGTWPGRVGDAWGGGVLAKAGTASRDTTSIRW